MKLKLKHLAAVVGIFAVAGPAMASIAPPSTGNSEMFLVVWDNTYSYTKDLGVRINDFTGEVGYSFDLNDSIFTRFSGVANVATSQFAVIGGDGVGPRRLFSTFDMPVTPFTADQNNQAIAWLGSYIQAQILLPADDTTHPGLPGINGTSIAKDPNDAFFNTNGNNGPNFQFNAVGWTNSVQVGTAASFRQFAHVTGDEETVQTDFGTLTAGSYGAWNVLQSPTGQWSVNYAVTAVPEPAGVMLMLAGLGALGLVARRRRQG